MKITNLLFSVLVLFGLSGGFAVAQPTTQPPPNIIIIYADDLGYGDLSSYGGDIPTPNIDRIGQAGIRFTDFYVSSPVCTPSRYSLLTGSYPQRSRYDLDKVIMPGDDNHFAEEEVTLAELLKTQGYRTAITGKWHLGSAQPSYLPMHQGFDLFSGHKAGCIDYFHHVYGGMGSFWFINGEPTSEEGYSTDLITDHAVDFIESAKSNTNPFFLYIPYNAPHFGKTDPDNVPEVTTSLFEGEYKNYKIMNSLQAPEKYVERFAHIEDPYRRLYSAMVASLDDNVGRLWEKLEKENLLENTIIWFVSDNGGYSETYYGHASNGPLRGEKATLWEGGIRVPAMVCWPGSIEANQVVDQPVCNIDIVPTLGAISGFSDALAKLPIDGVDISSVLFDQATIERDIFWRYQDETAFRRGNWKLRNSDELYDLSTDIGEKNNVARAHPDKLKELQQAFKAVDL
jgi:arylsulfatase A-like enzyme